MNPEPRKGFTCEQTLVPPLQPHSLNTRQWASARAPHFFLLTLPSSLFS